MALALIPIGSSRREKSWPTSNGGKLICRYKYFYILANDCQAASNIKWYTTDSSGEQEKEITYAQVKQIFPHRTPHLGVWERYALILISVFVLILILFGF